MGLPQIIIEFKTAGGSAVRRSARGQVVLLVPGEESGSAEYTSLPGEKPAGLSALGWRAVRLAMLGGPGKVVVRRYVPGTEEEMLEDCAPAAEGGWLCAPWMDGDAVAALVRKKRAAGSPLLDKLESAAAEGFSLCGRRLMPREVVSRIDGKEIPQVCFTLEYADVPGTEDGSGGQTDPAEPMGRMALRLERKEE